MEFITEDGIEFLVVPDAAVCKLTQKNPMDMDDCPCGLKVCCPETCEYYKEVRNNPQRKELLELLCE